MHTEFLIDFEYKEFETLTTGHDCDAIIIIISLDSKNNLADGSILKETFYARMNKTDARDPNFHLIFIDVLEEKKTGKDLEGST